MATTDLPLHPKSSDPSDPAFDIVSTYNRLLASDDDLTMPVAAIESLVEALAHSSVSTISETLQILSVHTEILKSAIANPISLSAGTDLFQRYLITTLTRPSAGGLGASLGPTGDFDAIRTHLLSNAKLFVQRAKESRDKIAGFGRHFVRDGVTVLTNGGSRVVGALLKSAAEAGGARFRVIYAERESSREGSGTVASLRARGIPVATIPDSAVAYSLGKVDMVIVGAEGVVENGGIISRMGTYQMGLLAKAKGKPFYVVAESHKFVREFPLNQFDLPINQKVIEFKVGEDEKVVDDARSTTQMVPDEAIDVADMAGQSKPRTTRATTAEDAVDFTPPDLISGIITESGVLTPSAVSEELIKIWF